MKHRVRGISIYKPADRSRRTDPYLLAYGPRNARKVITGSADLQVCIELASKLAGVKDREHHGLAEPHAVRYFEQGKRELTDHLDEYEDAIKLEGNTTKHAKQMAGYARKIIKGSGARLITDLVPSRLQRELAKVKGSEATRKRYRDALHGFLAWGAADHRWPAHRLTSLPSMRYAYNPTRTRRVLSLDQIAHIINTTETSKKLAENVPAAQRALIYCSVIAAGLRADEMRQLKVSDLGETGVYVLGKNKRRSPVTLPVPLLVRIRQHAHGRAPGARLFDMPWNPARMLRADLKAAGIPYKTADGVFDFHALRHQCGTILASAGVPAKAVQVHMRHSSIKLTLDTYGHLLDSDRDKTQEVVQRMAQRFSFSEVPQSSPKGSIVQKNQWSDGESNPDLLNAIQPSDFLNVSTTHSLLDRRGRRLAPRIAQRLLKRIYVRALRANPSHAGDARDGGAR